MLQASWGRGDKLQQEQNSPNHVQVLFSGPVLAEFIDVDKLRVPYLSLLFLHEEEEPVVEALHHAPLHLAQKHVLERAGALHAPGPGMD